MSMVTAWIPSVWITSSAWSRLSGEDVRYGIRTPITFSLPSASTARNAVSDESTPPESPTIPLVNPRRRTTSSFKKLTSHRRAKSASIARGSPSSTPFPTTCTRDAGSEMRDALENPLPPHHARRQPGAFLVHPRAARRRRTRHDDELGSLERGDRARERMPRVLAHQDRRAAPPGVEGPDLAAASHEPLLVEHSVRGEEHLAVHVLDARVLAAEGGVETRVVEMVLEH